MLQFCVNFVGTENHNFMRKNVIFSTFQTLNRNPDLLNFNLVSFFAKNITFLDSTQFRNSNTSNIPFCPLTPTIKCHNKLHNPHPDQSHFTYSHQPVHKSLLLVAFTTQIFIPSKQTKMSQLRAGWRKKRQTFDKYFLFSHIFVDR
jgi:hypothetical protein